MLDFFYAGLNFFWIKWMWQDILACVNRNSNINSWETNWVTLDFWRAPFKISNKSGSRLSPTDDHNYPDHDLYSRVRCRPMAMWGGGLYLGSHKVESWWWWTSLIIIFVLFLGVTDDQIVTMELTSLTALVENTNRRHHDHCLQPAVLTNSLVPVELLVVFLKQLGLLSIFTLFSLSWPSGIKQANKTTKIKQKQGRNQHNGVTPLSQVWWQGRLRGRRGRARLQGGELQRATAMDTWTHNIPLDQDLTFCILIWFPCSAQTSSTTVAMAIV